MDGIKGILGLLLVLILLISAIVYFTSKNKTSTGIFRLSDSFAKEENKQTTTPTPITPISTKGAVIRYISPTPTLMLVPTIEKQQTKGEQALGTITQAAATIPATGPSTIATIITLLGIPTSALLLRKARNF